MISGRGARQSSGPWLPCRPPGLPAKPATHASQIVLGFAVADPDHSGNPAAPRATAPEGTSSGNTCQRLSSMPGRRGRGKLLPPRVQQKRGRGVAREGARAARKAAPSRRARAGLAPGRASSAGPGAAVVQRHRPIAVSRQRQRQMDPLAARQVENEHETFCAGGGASVGGEVQPRLFASGPPRSGRKGPTPTESRRGVWSLRPGGALMWPKRTGRAHSDQVPVGGTHMPALHRLAIHGLNSPGGEVVAAKSAPGSRPPDFGHRSRVGRPAGRNIRQRAPSIT